MKIQTKTHLLTRSVSNSKQVVVLGTPKKIRQINGLINSCIQMVRMYKTKNSIFDVGSMGLKNPPVKTFLIIETQAQK